MGILMSEFFEKHFLVDKNDVTSPSDEKMVKIWDALAESLESAQRDYEENFRPPNDAIMTQAMTE